MRLLHASSSLVFLAVVAACGNGPAAGGPRDDVAEGEADVADDAVVALLSGAFADDHELPEFVDGFYYRVPAPNGIGGLVGGALAVTFPNACAAMSSYQAGVLQAQADFQIDHHAQALQDRTSALEAEFLPSSHWFLQVLPSTSEEEMANVNACQTNTDGDDDSCFSAFRKPVVIVDGGAGALVDIDGSEIELLSISLQKSALTFHLELPRCESYEEALALVP